MPNPVRTPTIDAFNNFSNQTDRTVQYQEALFNLKQALVASGGGGTVTRSSDGTNVSDGDEWVDANDVNAGTGGSESWCTITLGGSYGGTTLYCLLAATDAASPPADFTFTIAGNPFTGGDASTLPTTAGAQSSAIPVTPIIGTAVADRHWTSYTTANGDVFFLVKRNGVSQFDFGFMLFAFTDADGGGQGTHRTAIFVNESQTTPGGVTGAAFISNTNWRGLRSGGADATTADIRGSSGLQQANIQWTGGTAFDGSTVDDDNKIWDADTADGRFIGSHPDLFFVPNNLPYGTFDATENGQTFRRVCLGGTATIAPFFMYFPDADLGPEGAGAIP